MAHIWDIISLIAININAESGQVNSSKSQYSDMKWG